MREKQARAIALKESYIFKRWLISILNNDWNIVKTINKIYQLD